MYNGEFIVFVNAYNYKERSYYQTIENFIIPSGELIHKCLKGYKGIINLEIKNDIIVDVRLTLGDLVHFYNYEFFDEIDNFFREPKQLQILILRAPQFSHYSYRVKLLKNSKKIC